MEVWVIVFSLLCFKNVLVNAVVQCRDENNNPVDWYVLYKLPLIKNDPHPLIKEGKGYMYITSRSTEKEWQFSSKAIDSDSTLLAKTLQFINDKDQNVLWFVYNDQGNETCYDCGHTKGVVAGDKEGGIWLVHSIPHFLRNIYPKTGVKFGQSALCMTFPQTTLDTVGDLLAYNTPKFQEWNIESELKEFYPKILSAFNHSKASAPWTVEKSLTSSQGTEFHTFAKAKQFNNDLYEWVASSLQTDVSTETWINDQHVLPSSCGIKFRVMNIESVKIPSLNVTFTSHKDHSKFAVSDVASKPWICVGDINRAESQKERGGGTVCMNNKSIWEAYRNLINSTEKCPSETLPSVLLVNNGA